jgi:predicted esterase
MRQVGRRRAGVWAKVCLLALLALVVSARQARAAPLELQGADGELDVVIYPAVQPGARGVTVVLHGMCGDPQRTCAHFAEQITQREHLVCPRASQRCDGGGASWPQANFAVPVERAVKRAEVVLAERVDASAGRTLIGYSLGAYRAAELLQHPNVGYRRAMLIGARVVFDARRLRESGVEKLLLAAGAWDMTYQPMQREAGRLARGGVAVRFLGLGPVGHAFTPSFGPYLERASAWLRGEDGVS